MKIIRTLISFAAVLLLLVQPVSAEKVGTAEEKIREEVGFDRIYDSVPDEVREDGILDEIDFTDPDLFSSVMKKIASSFSVELFDAIKFFSGLIGLCLICAVLRSIGENLSGKTVNSVISLISVLSVTLFTYRELDGLYNSALGYITTVNQFIVGIMPTLTALTAIGGGVAGSVVQNAGIGAAVAFLDTAAGSILAPVIRFLFGFSIVSAAGEFKLSGISKTVKRLVTVGITFVMTLLSAVLIFQNSFASAADGLALKSAKFASATLIPIIGPMISEAAGTVGGSISFLKNTAGLIAVTVVIFLLLVPIIKIVIRRLFLSAAQLVCEMLNLDKTSEIIGQLKDILTLISAFCLASGIFFILALTVFVKTGVGV